MDTLQLRLRWRAVLSVQRDLELLRKFGHRVSPPVFSTTIPGPNVAYSRAFLLNPPLLHNLDFPRHT